MGEEARRLEIRKKEVETRASKEEEVPTVDQVLRVEKDLNPEEVQKKANRKEKEEAQTYTEAQKHTELMNRESQGGKADWRDEGIPRDILEQKEDLVLQHNIEKTSSGDRPIEGQVRKKGQVLSTEE